MAASLPHGQRKGSPKSNSDNGPVAVSRHVLPSDLPTAIKHLDDQELNQLFAAVVAERSQRDMKSPVPEQTPSHRTVDAAAVSLNLSKVNAGPRCFQSWRDTLKNCQRVRNFSSGCSEGNCQRRFEAMSFCRRSRRTCSRWRAIREFYVSA